MLLSVIEEKPMVNLSFPLAQPNITGERRGGGGVFWPLQHFPTNRHKSHSHLVVLQKPGWAQQLYLILQLINRNSFFSLN